MTRSRQSPCAVGIDIERAVRADDEEQSSHSQRYTIEQVHPQAETALTRWPISPHLHKSKLEACDPLEKRTGTRLGGSCGDWQELPAPMMRIMAQQQQRRN